MKSKNLRVPYGLSVHGNDEIKAVIKVLKSSTQMGKHVSIFEKKISKLFSKKYGIKRRTYCLLGSPPESYETIKQTEKFIEEVEPDIIGFSIMAPYPGTAYWKKEYDEMDWTDVDEFSNTMWHSDHLTNEQIRHEQ